ncbi:MAG TPA: oxidoreductase, partial [Planctomycetaceae bacterium]|nr:oxidoreductase [Planctomycetaceae bacterium]
MQNKKLPSENKSSKLTRRDFIATASTAFMVPTIVPSSVFGSNAPSNRINIAQIG